MFFPFRARAPVATQKSGADGDWLRSASARCPRILVDGFALTTVMSYFYCSAVIFVSQVHSFALAPVLFSLDERGSLHRRPHSFPTALALRQVLQILADVFQAPVFTAAASDSAAIGAALRAKHGVECRRRGLPYIPFAEIYG